MAVYTTLDKEQIEDFLSHYDCGKLISFEGIVQGVENTNYKIETDKDKFILTVFEKRTNKSDLPFFFDFMNHLHSRLIHCPLVLATKKGGFTGFIAGKTASLISFLEGGNVDALQITPQLCYEAGAFIARMHEASSDFRRTRNNSMSLPAWEGLYQKIKEKQGSIPLIEEELSRAALVLALNLPKAVVHADIFPDNVFTQGGHINGIIDFYFSCTDFLVYDLAIAANAWCFENAQLDKKRFDQMIAGYESVRKLTKDEHLAFRDVSRMAALRILMTRTHDWLFHDPAALVKPKDPAEYQQILEFHRHEPVIG